MNWKKQLSDLITECVEHIKEEAKEAIIDGEDWCVTLCNVNDGYIDITYKESGNCAVDIHHDNDNNKISLNFEEWLENELRDCVDWCELEEEREERHERENRFHTYLNNFIL